MLGDDNSIRELVDCGDSIPDTTSPTGIPVARITIGECLQRRCCCYTGVNKDGDEYCLNGNDSPADELVRVQTNGTFRVCECVASWRATISVNAKPNIEIQCGETIDLPPSTRFSKVVITACPAVRDGAVVDTDGEFIIDEFDAATADVDFQFDQAVDEADFQFDQAVDEVDFQYDQAFDEFADVQYDQAIDEFADVQFDQAVDEFADVQYDQAVDEADFQYDQAFDEFADVQYDQAIDEFADVQFESFADDSFVGDAATADQFESTFAADQAVDQFTDSQFDQAVGDSFETFADDSIVGDAQLEQAVADMAVEEEFVDATYETGLDEQFDQFADQ